MKTILELFRDSVAFKLLIGIMSFLFVHQMNTGSEETQEDAPYLETSFEQKFLEVKTFYLEDYTLE